MLLFPPYLSFKKILNKRLSVMKHMIMMLSFITLCMQHSLFPMDPPVAENPKDAIITTICDQINEIYREQNKEKVGLLNYAEALNIMNIVGQHPASDIIDNALCTQLCRNQFFNKAVEYFLPFATKNAGLLTTKNITIFENPIETQPTPELNALPLSIKKYIMEHTLDQICFQCKYRIQLETGSLNNIIAFDVCEFTDQAVTSTSISHEVILWNLKTKEIIHRKYSPDLVTIVAFNANGSYMATISKKENTHIKLWSLSTNELDRKFSCDWPIERLLYSQPTGSILRAYKENSSNSDFKDFIINPVCEMINDTGIYSSGRSTFSDFEGNKYKAAHPSRSNCDKLYVEPKDLKAMSICMKAIQQTAKPDMSEIENSVSFGRLTELQRKEVYDLGKSKLGLLR